MNTKLINFIVKKYLKWDNKNPFISISAFLAFIGVGVGVMVLIIAMAIMNGTAKEFQDKLFTMNYPLSIYAKFNDNSVNDELLKQLESNFPKLKFSPYLSSQVMVNSNNSMTGGILFGVNNKKESQINKIYANGVKSIDKFNKYHLVVGQEMQDTLDLQSNQKITLYFTQISPNGLYSMPKIKRFTYKSKFTSGLTSYDKSYMYTSIESLQTILQKSKNVYDGIHIYSNTPFKDIEKIKKLIPPTVGVVGWWQQNGNFFSAMRMEKKALFIVLMLIILIASLNIISSLLMTVMSRRKEIALLLSQGASEKEIKQIFLRLGLIIGFSGIVVGICLGFSGIFLLENFNIISLPADVYGTSKLPLLLSNSDLISIIFGSAIIVFLSSYYPAKKATKIDVIDVLRNE
ncbi:Lipoprotein releasing system transmembrane protein LolC [hydrothermal vent metagenome]|uniref:Lipoprotein releasing system transmembrane protein LolC n=1 Tax=hydrothermal vent metagenome TaxID=652676 RepID=A0A3B1E254_9ZZZZ